MTNTSHFRIKYYQHLCKVAFLLALITCQTAYAQIGINTTDPKGTLDVTSINNTGFVMPRVSALENVTDGDGNPPVNGTMIFDISRNATCFYQNDEWICVGVDAIGNPQVSSQTPVNWDAATIDYIKASNCEATDNFGRAVALSNDGLTMAIAATSESSDATGVNGDQTNNNGGANGAVYVFVKTGNTWSQQAYIKASYSGFNDQFGLSLALSNDGNTLAIGSYREDSNATGINGDQTNNATIDSGAVYILTRTATVWSQEAYIKASNPGAGDHFSQSIDLSDDGNTLAVGTQFEDSNATGINGDQNNNSASNSGAVYIFTRSVTTWSQQAYIKASNTESNDAFGFRVSLASNGDTLAVGAYNEASNASGINGNQNSNTLSSSGAVYIFVRVANVWSQEAYLKASNPDANDQFGDSVALSTDGNTLAVGATGESSNATGINGDQTNNSLTDSGAVYIFKRVAAVWSQESYIKPDTVIDADDKFGFEVKLSTNGSTLAICARNEASNATGVNGNPHDDFNPGSGAVYILTNNNNNWSQVAYVKASNSDWFEYFGSSFGLSEDGKILAAGAYQEDSNATGINGDQTNNTATDSGAAYVFTIN